MENNFLNFSLISVEQAKQMNVQVLAFVGDSVHTLFVRTKVTMQSNIKSGGLHKIANEFISAVGQNKLLEKVKSLLNENEEDIFKRARNYKTNSMPKNAEVKDYKNATGLEAVLGFLFLTGQFERINELLQLAFNQNN